MMSHQTVGKALMYFFNNVGWVFIGLSALITVYAIARGMFLLLVMPSLVLAAFGVTTVIITQIGLAQIATAENTYAIYGLVKANLANNPKATNSFVKDVVVSASNLQEGVRRIKIYKGREILKTNEGVVVGDEVFANVLEAEKWIAAQDNE